VAKESKARVLAPGGLDFGVEDVCGREVDGRTTPYEGIGEFYEMKGL